ncbi:MAG TPA: proline--tRNA ligase, partial [Bacteroidales bacterium]|nr:proline--tRNA ligase [Bacteroidales bacterium]
FAKECAVVTHYRLKNDEKGKGIVVDPDAKLEEELIIRPTSETIIWNSYRNWIHSYRDLPILINQWANVVRWEMRTRLFLRTTEFLWQEGHTAHATSEEASEETKTIIDLYAHFVQDYMGIPVLKGYKSDSEKFAGAIDTFAIEALMQDGKALQVGTSHFLGQNFARAFDVQFTDKSGNLEYVYSTSWGVSTRLMGALVMAHGDNNGLVLPPNLAPIQVAIIPIYKGNTQLSSISDTALKLKSELEKADLRVKYDARDTHKPGFKFAEYELKGVPVRLAIGSRDIENGTVEVARRDTMTKEIVKIDKTTGHIKDLMTEIQKNIFNKSLEFRNKNTYEVNTWDEFRDSIETRGGFILAHWDGTAETEEKIKNETKASIRVIPFDETGEEGKCIYSGKPSKRRVVFARAY